MKTHLRVCLALLLCDLAAHAAVLVSRGRIDVHGTLEGDQLMETSIGETLDYLTFQVTARTAVRLIGTDLTRSIFLAMGQVIPGEPFDIVEPPYRLFATSIPPEFTHILDPGVYLVQVAVEAYREGDLGNTFVPVQNTDAILSVAPYSFALEGDIHGLQFMEGNRDRTFTVTPVVPEPSAATLILTAATATALRRRRK